VADKQKQPLNLQSVADKQEQAVNSQKDKIDTAIKTEIGSKSGKIWKCNVCDKEFKKRNDLERHNRTHTGEKPFECTVCQKRFSFKSAWKTHSKTHTGGKSFSCHLCGSLFASKPSLKVHMRIHTGLTPYSCSQCDQTFRTPHQRQVHVTRTHSSRQNVGATADTNDDLVPLIISAESLISALKGISDNGSLDSGLMGATLQLQLHAGQDLKADNNLLTVTVTVDNKILDQLQRRQNISILIKKKDLEEGNPIILENSMLNLPTLEEQNKDYEGSINQVSSDQIQEKAGVTDEGIAEAINDEAHESQTETFVIFQDNQILPEDRLFQDSDALSSVQPDQSKIQLVNIQPQSQVIVDYSSIHNLDEVVSKKMEAEAGDMNDEMVEIVGVEGLGRVIAEQEEKMRLARHKEQQESLLEGTSGTTISREVYRYICPWCGIIFSSEQARIEHLLSAHNVEVKEDKVDEGMTDDDAYILPHQHLTDQHSDPQPSIAEAAAAAHSRGGFANKHTCSTCFKTFAKPSLLIRHERIHTGEKPFLCAHCNKSFNQKNSLLVHQRIHDGLKPFVCEFCEQAFNQKSNLKNHILRFHPNNIVSSAEN